MLDETDVSNNDVYNLDYFYQQNVCRLCWNTNAEIEIFTKTETETVKSQLIDKIKDCLDLNFTVDSHPRLVCHACCNRIEEFYTFKCFCRRNNDNLQKIINGAYNTDNATNSEVKIELLHNDENLQNDIPVTFIESIDEPDYNKTSELMPKISKSKSKRVYNDFSDRDSDYQPPENELETHETEDTHNTTRKKKIKIKNIHTRNNHLKLEQAMQVPKRIRSLLKKKVYKRKRCVSYCNICRTDLGTKENLSMHNSLNHGIEEGDIYKCFGCDRRFKTRKARLAHEIKFCKGLKEGYKCGKCDRFLPKRSMYEAHMRDHRQNSTVVLPEKIFQCPKCYILFETKICLKEHMAIHDIGKKNYVCETCGRVFTRQDYLHKHKLTHTGTKQHICSHCGYRTAQKSSLTVHIRKHTGERPYSCELCPQRCTSSSNLRAHTRRHMDLKKFECTICNKKFGYKKSLEEHVASIHERSQSFSCEQCGATYTRTQGLRRHILAKHSKQDKAYSPIDGADQQKDENSAFLVKMPEDKKTELKDNEMFQIKENEGFVLLNADNTILLTKMY